MALGDWTTTFETLPADSENAGLGDDRIRTLKAEVRTRLAVETDFGDSTFDATYGDTGKLLPGAARVYRATGALPTALQKRDGTAQSISLNSQDTGRICWDQRGFVPVMCLWDGALSTPAWVAIGNLPNLLINSGMQINQRVFSGSSTLTGGTRTYTLDRWGVTVTGASTADVDQVTTGLPTGAASRYGLRIIGAAAVSNVDLDQRVEAAQCADWAGYVTVRVGWKYDDGAAGTITPSFRVDTANASDNFAAVTNRLSQAFTAGSDGYFTHTFDLSALTNYANGCQFVVRFSGATDLNAATKNVVITDFTITPGQAPAQKYQKQSFADDLRACQRYYQKSFAYATLPAQNWVGAGSGIPANSIAIPGSSASIGANNTGASWFHNPVMRTTPTVTTYNPRAANADAVQIDGAGDLTLTVTAGATVTNFAGNTAAFGNSDQALCFGAQFVAEL